MPGQIHRRFNPSFIVNFDDNDNVASVWTQFGDMPTIKEMNGIIEYAKAYLDKYKTQDALDLIDYKNREADRIEQEKKDRREREERKAQKFQKKPETPCDIYLIKDAIRGVHKIGKAVNFNERFKQLRTANAGIEKVAHYKGLPSDEVAIHAVLEGLNKRVSGEWFSLNEEDIAYFHFYFRKEPLAF